jgi:hypothetical protein
VRGDGSRLRTVGIGYGSQSATRYRHVAAPPLVWELARRQVCVWESALKAHLVAFGSIEIDGRRHEHDVVIDRGDVRKRIKKPSKPHRARYGHTPLSADEDIPWSGSQLIIGTGAYGSLPITPELRQEADRRGVELVATTTEDACRLIASLDRRDVNAILHVTC